MTTETIVATDETSALIQSDAYSFGYTATKIGVSALTDWSQYIPAISDGKSWDATTITYTFSAISAHGALRYANNIRNFTLAEQQAVDAVFDVIESFTNLNFERAMIAGTADISFYIGDLTLEGAAGLAGTFYTGNTLTGAAVGIDYDYSDFEESGSTNYVVLLHEIGHALGLKHSGEYSETDSGPFLPEDLDNQDNTVMSYNAGSSVADSYRYLDRIALQSLYGGESSGGETGETGSGGDDTIIGGDGPGDTFAGGAGNDVIYATDENDVIYGGSGVADSVDGNDLIYANLGDDLVYGNYGNDTIYGGYDPLYLYDGNDTIYGGRDSDVIYGGGGNDWLAGGGGLAHPEDEADTIFGGRGSDFIVGNGGDDYLDGGITSEDAGGVDGADTIYGGFGNDEIIGSAGSDLLYGQLGDDTIEGSGNTSGAAETNTIYGGTGNDLIYGDSRSNTDAEVDYYDPSEDPDAAPDSYPENNPFHDLLFGEEGDDTIYGGDGNDTIDAGAGNDVLHGNLGNDTFVFNTNYGVNIIHNFNPTYDTISIAANTNGLNLTAADIVARAVQTDGGLAIDLSNNGQTTVIVFNTYTHLFNPNDGQEGTIGSPPYLAWMPFTESNVNIF
jgi:Ca2+-binding RTX toxin-like protein